MKRKAIIASMLAGVLACTLGLTGCGGSNKSDASSSESTEEKAAPFSMWTGKFEDGKSFLYLRHNDGDDALVTIFDDDDTTGDNAEIYNGVRTQNADGSTVTVTDKDSGNTLTFTLAKAEDGSIDVTIDGHGTTKLNQITEDELVDEFGSFGYILKLMIN